MISSDVLLGSQNILDDSSWGPQKRFFGFSFGGYVEGGVNVILPVSFNLISRGYTDKTTLKPIGNFSRISTTGFLIISIQDGVSQFRPTSSHGTT